MAEFKKIYVWAMNAKLYMGIYFTAVALLTGIVRALFGDYSLSLLVLLEMLLLSAAVAVLQAVLLDETADYSRGIFFLRSVVWLSASVALTVLCALVFKWFEGLGVWCPFLLGAFMVFGFSAMLIGLKLEQDADTVRLNSELQSFREKTDK